MRLFKVTFFTDEAIRGFRRAGRLTIRGELKSALEEGAVDRVRPKLMTVSTTIVGLPLIMIGDETAAEVMKRIAAPMVGGLVTSTIHTLVMIPALYAVVHGRKLRADAADGQGEDRPEDPERGSARTTE